MFISNDIIRYLINTNGFKRARGHDNMEYVNRIIREYKTCR